MSAKFLIEFWFVMRWVPIPGSQHDGSRLPACSSEIKNIQHVSNAFRYRRGKFRKVCYIGRKTVSLEWRWEPIPTRWSAPIPILISAPTSTDHPASVREHHRRHGLQSRLLTTSSNTCTGYTWQEIVIQYPYRALDCRSFADVEVSYLGGDSVPGILDDQWYKELRIGDKWLVSWIYLFILCI